MPINDGMAWGCAQAPLGFEAATSFLTTLDLKGPSVNIFKKHQKKSFEVISKVAEKSMIEAGKQEKQLAEDAGDFVELDGVTYPSVAVKVDGGWSKRCYHGHGFNSHCGTAVGIGAKTKKIVFNDTRVRTCITCDKAKNKNEEPKPHECYKNWSLTSTAMESDIIRAGFQDSIKTHGLVYSRFVGDGDSSTHSAIINVYNGIQVQKIECTNHVMRNLTSKLMQISSNKSKSIPANVRRIDGMAIRFERITGDIVGAINHHITNLDADTWKMLRADILNVPRHVFGDHHFCRDYFCPPNSPRRSEKSIYNDVSSSTLYTEVMIAVKRVASLATSLLERMNTNEAECFMSVVNKYIEGKRKHFGHSYVYNLRISCSILAYNISTFWAAEAYQMAFNKPPSTLWKDKEQVTVNARNKQLKKHRRKRPRYAFLKSRTGDKNYGSHPIKPDLEDVDKNEMELKIIELFQSLQLDDARKKEVEELTRTQSNSDAWFNERFPRITASTAHLISRLQKTTDNTSVLNSVLGRSRFSTEATKYGHEHESDAVSSYEQIMGFPPGYVRPVGLLVSSENGILASSPDGLVGDDGLLEVKCPSNWREADLKLWPRLLPPKKQRKDSDQPRLRVSDPYYTQAVMQIYTTGRNWVDFFVWNPVSHFIQRIHRNEVNDRLWEDIKNKLIEFWKTEMAPELVDSRYLRGMEYRCPESRMLSRAKMNEKRYFVCIMKAFFVISSFKLIVYCLKI